MCGRYTLITDIVDILSHFDINIFEDRGNNPQFNVAPSFQMPIIDQSNDCQKLKWGINYRNHYVINVKEDGNFKFSKRFKRCIVPANGYYEWKKIGKSKQPYYFTLPNFFMFAGLYQEGDDSGFTIMTTKANSQVLPYHHRMPIILSTKKACVNYLNEYMIPKQNPTLNIYPVSNYVSNVRNNTSKCIYKIELEQKQQLSLSDLFPK